MFTRHYINFSTQMYLIFKSTRVQNRRRPFVSGTSWIIFNITYLILFSKTSAQNCLSVERRYGVLMCVEGDSRITPCLIAFHCASSSKPPKDDNHYVSLTLTMTRMSELNKGWATQTSFATILFDPQSGRPKWDISPIYSDTNNT